MRKRNTVSKEVRERICKLPSRHGHVTWFGTNAYVHGTPRLFRSPSCTTPPRQCRQAKASAHKTPSLVHRHRLSQSITNGTICTIGASHQEGSPSPHKVSLPLHTKSEGHTTSTRLLAAARLLSSLLSQELSLNKC